MKVYTGKILGSLLGFLTLGVIGGLLGFFVGHLLLIIPIQNSTSLWPYPLPLSFFNIVILPIDMNFGFDKLEFSILAYEITFSFSTPIACIASFSFPSIS